MRACLPCLYNWFLFSCSLDSAFLSGVSVSPTCYFEPPTPSCPTLSFWGLPVLQRDSVHNPRCPIQQHPSSTFLPHQPAFTFPLTNMELFLFKCLCLSYLIMLFWFLPFFFFLFQFAFFCFLFLFSINKMQLLKNAKFCSVFFCIWNSTGTQVVVVVVASEIHSSIEVWTRAMTTCTKQTYYAFAFFLAYTVAALKLNMAHKTKVTLCE